MYQTPFRWKLYAGCVVLILLTAIVITVLGTHIAADEARQDVKSSLTHDTVFLRELALEALRTGRDDSLQARVRAIGQRTRKRLTVIAKSGQVLADSDEQPDRMGNHADRPEILEAIRTGRLGASIRFSRTVNRELMYVARSVFDQGTLLGTVRASQNLSMIESRIGNLRWSVIVGSAVAALVACVLGWVFAKRVTAPLFSMKQIAESMAAGNYDQKVLIASDDEFGALARALNSMAEQLYRRLDEMKREEGKLRSILESMVEGVVATDRRERIVHLNDVAASILDISPDDAMGRPLWEVTRFPRVGDAIVETLDSGKATSTEIIVPQNGMDRIVQAQSSALRDSQSRVVGAVLVMHDISELRQLEKMRREFVSNVSHELKTPLTAIRGIVETMLDDTSMDSSTRTRFLARIRNQTERLSALVSDLLHLSRVESAVAPEHVPVDVREPVRESVHQFLPDSEELGLTICLDLPEESVIVHGDAEALRQVVDNLLQNAIKYTPGDGRIEVHLRRNSTTAILEVRDTGIGIEPRHQDRIFERFYRVDTARSRDLGGTGLGLAIVKHVVLSHGGEVGVDSVPGKGSTFRVSLPLST